jgi:hypothetical protein
MSFAFALLKPCCRCIWLGLPVKCSVCWTLYCHLSSPNGLVPWGVRYELFRALVHLCSWVHDVNPLPSAFLKVTVCGPPFTNQAIASTHVLQHLPRR